MRILKNIMNLLINLLRWPLLYLKKNRMSLSKVYLSGGSHLRGNKIGDYCFIGINCVLNYAEIGAYTCIASGVQIGGMEHPHWELTISPKLTNDYIFGKKTIIGHDVWIGANVIIKQGVKIGNGAVIGAGSFVNKDIPAYAIYFGTPAKLYKYRECKNNEEELDNSFYWNYPPSKAKQILSQIGKQ